VTQGRVTATLLRWVSLASWPMRSFSSMSSRGPRRNTNAFPTWLIEKVTPCRGVLDPVVSLVYSMVW